MTTSFVFEDARGKHIITMKKASAEWCNSDCPDIFTVSDNVNENNWRINSGGTYIKSLPEWMAKRFIKFFLSSSKAFYKKYPQCRSDYNRNGFWANFLKDNYNYSDLIYKTVGNITPEKAF